MRRAVAAICLVWIARGQSATDLPARLAALKTTDERRQLLRETNTTVTPAFVGELLRAIEPLRQKADFPGAIGLTRFALELAAEIGDKLRTASAHYSLGILLKDQGDYEEAREQLGAALVFCRE